MEHSRTMKPFFSVAVLALVSTASLLPAAEPDLTIVPGERVGAVTKTSTLQQLIKAYGADKVKATDLPGPEGSTIEGAIIFGGTDREMHVIWDPEKPKKAVFDVELIGKAWKLDSGLKVGSTLKEAVAANGGPFQVYGFEWDMGGCAVIETGKLAGKVNLRFKTTGKVAEEIVGDRLIPTTNAKLIAAKPVVETLSVSVR